METKKYSQALDALKSGFPVDDEYGREHFALSDVNRKIIEKALKIAIRNQDVQESRNHDLTAKFKAHVEECLDENVHGEGRLKGCTSDHQVELRGEEPDLEYFVAVDVKHGGDLLPLFALNALGKSMACWAGTNLDIVWNNDPSSSEVQLVAWDDEEFVTLQMYLAKKER